MEFLLEQDKIENCSFMASRSQHKDVKVGQSLRMLKHTECFENERTPSGSKGLIQQRKQMRKQEYREPLAIQHGRGNHRIAVTSSANKETF